MLNSTPVYCRCAAFYQKGEAGACGARPQTNASFALIWRAPPGGNRNWYTCFPSWGCTRGTAVAHHLHRSDRVRVQDVADDVRARLFVFAAVARPFGAVGEAKEPARVRQITAREVSLPHNNRRRRQQGVVRREERGEHRGDDAIQVDDGGGSLLPPPFSGRQKCGTPAQQAEPRIFCKVNTVSLFACL